jgi:putative ABC transport system permease protein
VGGRAGSERVTLGFETEEVTTFKLALPAVRYLDAASVRGFTADMLAGVRGVPGVRSAAATSRPPLVDGSSIGFAWTTPTSLEGVHPTQVAMRWATDGYFETMGIELVEGRPLRAEDGSDSIRVSVVSRSLAEALWPGRSAIGRRWKLGRLVGPTTAWRTVVGVVEDIRDAGPNSEIPAMAYFPQSQLGLGREMHVVAASSIPEASLVSTVRGVIAGVDPTLPMYDVRSMTRLLERRTALNRIGGHMLVLFATLALLLAAVGVYGLTGFLLAERTREFGVRAAVGASRDQLVGLIVRDGAKLAAQGVALGLIVGIGLTRLLQSLLVGVPLIDVTTLLSASMVMALVSVVASLMPARAIVPDDPARVLRD